VVASDRPKARFRGSIRARVLTIVLIPVLGLLAVGLGFSGYLFEQGRQERTFARSTNGLNALAAAWMIGMQQERLLSIEKLSGVPGLAGPLARIRQQVDASLGGMTQLSAQMASSGGSAVSTRMNAFKDLLNGLGQLRAGIDSGQVSRDVVYQAYNQMLDNNVASMQAVAGTAPDAAVATSVQTTLQVFVMADAMSRSAALGTAIASGSPLPTDMYVEYLRQVGFYHAQLTRLLPTLDPGPRRTLTTLTQSGPWTQLVDTESRLQAIAARGGAPGQDSTRIRPDWVDAAGQVGGGLLGVFQSQGAGTVKLISANGDRTYRQSLLGAVGVLALTLLTVLVAWLLSTRLVRRLSRLRAETLEAAHRGLPEVVARLRAGEPVDPATALPTLDYGEDEIGQLAGAFSAAQRAAVTATVDEARTRAGTQAAFLAIAHRSQVLMHRHLEVLDQAERSQEDPEQLQLLFELDHLATRARRNAENLIILGGEQPGRQWRRPVRLAEVIRGGVAETEHYARVTVIPSPDVWVDGAVVADLVHLLAELVDNATAFSPPQSRVEVRSGPAGRGVVIEIEDRGLGLDEATMQEINTTLRNPPEFNVLALSTQSRLGVFVVARLAARLGAQVTLVDSPYGGVRAIVLIPSSAIVPSSADDAADAPPEVIALREPLTRRQRRLGWDPLATVPEQGARSGGSLITGPLGPVGSPPPDVPAPAAIPPGSPTPSSGVIRLADPPPGAPSRNGTGPVPVNRAAIPAGDGPGPLPGEGSEPPPGEGSEQAVPALLPSEPLPSEPLRASLPSSSPAAPPPPSSLPPPLPRRKRQDRLSATDRPPGDGSTGMLEPPHLDWVSPEMTRDRLAAFQAGSRAGRRTPPQP
jgi:signal transduction histidine kinase